METVTGDKIELRRVLCVLQMKSSQQAEPEALLDLILESQSQRLDDQRASLSLLPDSEPAAPCRACSPDQNSVPTLDFYYMLIHYQVPAVLTCLPSGLVINTQR